MITIQKAIDASPELRSKKALIENFIDGVNDVSDVMIEWREYVAAQKSEANIYRLTQKYVQRYGEKR